MMQEYKLTRPLYNSSKGQLPAGTVVRLNPAKSNTRAMLRVGSIVTATDTQTDTEKSANTVNADDLDQFSKDELKAIADDIGVEYGKRDTNTQIIALIEAAETEYADDLVKQDNEGPQSKDELAAVDARRKYRISKREG